MYFVKSIGLLTLSLIIFNVSGQQNKNIDKSYYLNFYVGYPYYFMNLEKYGDYLEVNNKFNFAIAGLFGKYFNSTNIEFGIGYFTKNYQWDFKDLNSTLEKENVQLEYLFFPISINQKLFTTTKNNLSLLAGIIFLKPFNYSKETIYKDGTQNIKDKILVDYKIGNLARIGLKYSQSVSMQLNLFIETYGDYKFNLDYYESHPKSDYSNLTDDRFGIGVNIGFEFIFNNKENIKS